MFNLDEFQDLIKIQGVFKYNFHQCRFGAKWEKSTDILTNIEGLVIFQAFMDSPLVRSDLLVGTPTAEG